MSRIEPIGDDLLSAAAVADPYTYFNQLRERDPVHWNERFSSWVITRHADVSAGFRGQDLSSDRVIPYVATLPAEERKAREPTFRVLTNWMVFRDPPDHTRLRRLVYRAFAGPALTHIAGRVDVIVDELLEGLGNQARIDLIQDFAYPLPAIVIAEMLGVPPSDRELFKGWSDDITSLVFAALDVPDRQVRAQKGLIELSRYLGDLVEEYRDAPSDNLISQLIAVEEEGERLSRDELVATCALLLFGGHETTTNLVANGILALLRNPQEMHRLRSNPELMPSAVEEILRYDGPARMALRVVAGDHEVGGRTLRKGDRVFLVPAAANRDPAVFENPDQLDIARSPNRHIGFGFGAHYCLGAALARLEGKIAIWALIKRLDGLRLADEQLSWHPTMLSRGLRELPLEYDEFLPPASLGSGSRV